MKETKAGDNQMNRKDYYFGLAVLTDVAILGIFTQTDWISFDDFLNFNPWIKGFFYAGIAVILALIINAIAPRFLKAIRKD